MNNSFLLSAIILLIKLNLFRFESMNLEGALFEIVTL